MYRKIRIKKTVYTTGDITYNPQIKIFFMWFDVGVLTELVAKIPRPMFVSLHKCKKYIYDVISPDFFHKHNKPIIVEHIEVK